MELPSEKFLEICNKIDKAIDIAEKYVNVPDRNKQWVIDQMLRVLFGHDLWYISWVAEYEQRNSKPEYDYHVVWDTGISPTNNYFAEQFGWPFI